MDNTLDLSRFVISDADAMRDMPDVQSEVLKQAVAKVAALNEKTTEQALIVKHQERIAELEAYINDPGYVRVPVEPTEAMLRALIGRSYIGISCFDQLKSSTIDGYKAMLSASKGEN